MASETEIMEQRLTLFTGQLEVECGILERLVYKHKNQHRRCTYFQYVLKLRRDLKLLKSAKMEDILDASFVVINGNRPKQKLQPLESLKRKRCDNEKNNFLERLLGVARLLSQMVEPILKATMEISKLLAQSFFMKFALTTMAVLARIRVLVQQILIDIVHVYNTVSSLSQIVVILECIWQKDKYVLIERTDEYERTGILEKDLEDDSLKPSNILYEKIELLLGSTTNSAENPSIGEQEDEASKDNLVWAEDVSIDPSSQGIETETKCEMLVAAEVSCIAKSLVLDDVKHKIETKKKKVAFISV